MILCPRCNVQLRVQEEANVEIDVCDSCSGIWLDAGELARISDQTRASINDLSTKLNELRCPRCNTHDFTSIETDFGAFAMCRDCAGMFVGGDTRDAITTASRNELPSLAGSQSKVVGLQAIPEVIIAILEAIF